MLKSQLETSILIPKGISISNNLPHQSFATKEELIKLIQQHTFDILVSNGCPFILPVKRLKKPHQIFINIHPSLLPSLKGAHPINGAILFNQPTGATCHIMNDNIDDGAIISQIQVYNSSNIPLKLLYQMCFLAEVEAFKKALKRNFSICSIQPVRKESYFTRTENLMHINFEDMDTHKIMQNIQAFCIKKQYAKIIFKHHIIPIYDAKIIKNTFLKKHFCNAVLNEIVMVYEDCILLNRDKVFLQLQIPSKYINILKIGINLAQKTNIYQTTPYIKATKQTEQKIFDFHYQKGSYVFSNRAIKSRINKSEYFDIASPYGFAGYYTNTSNLDFIQEALLQQEKKAQQENIIAEFIRFHPLCHFSQNFSQLLDLFQMEREVIEVTTNPQTRWQNYPSRIRSKIRKALRELSINQSYDAHQFHYLYTQTMKRNNAQNFYYFNLEYFQKLIKFKECILLEAKINGQTCGMAMFLYDDYTSYYHLGATSDSSIQNNINPMCGLFESFFQIASSKGIQSCILGGGRTSSKEDSLFLFKKQFSPILKPFYIGGKIYNQAIYQELCADYNNPFFLKYRFADNLSGGGG
ncbi:hypothetical protein BBW65_03980 [Helicobacter enhydrae]|uniref:Formyl transferase N-terminal domain-containing protein n=2 Tax=Helicobacter enhydrae TaxID=222136 RepID=A0A1B1U5H4_9HELI|nr:hypothetical protein BBW65_03980 [Helicobacter enhydrae]